MSHATWRVRATFRARYLGGFHGGFLESPVGVGSPRTRRVSRRAPPPRPRNRARNRATKRSPPKADLAAATPREALWSAHRTDPRTRRFPRETRRIPLRQSKARRRFDRAERLGQSRAGARVRRRRRRRIPTRRREVQTPRTQTPSRSWGPNRSWGPAWITRVRPPRPRRSVCEPRHRIRTQVVPVPSGGRGWTAREWASPQSRPRTLPATRRRGARAWMKVPP